MRLPLIHLKCLSPLDMIFAAYHLLLMGMTIAGAASIPFWPLLAAYNIGLVVFILYICREVQGFGPEQSRPRRFARVLRVWYVVPAIFLTYKQIYILVPALRPELYDTALIAADRFLFRMDISVFLSRFAHPLLTEVLQISYGSFYLLPFILGGEILRKKMFRAFNFCTFCVIFGFFLAYLGYFMFPAIGPRFTLHDFYAINTELPGLLLTNGIREFVNLGASASSTHPQAAELIQRDVFPSAHTQVTLITVYLSLKLKAAARFFLVPVGGLLIFSTLYLRYHYLVDIAGGFIFCVIALSAGKKLYNAWQTFRGERTFSFSQP